MNLKILIKLLLNYYVNEMIEKKFEEFKYLKKNFKENYFNIL